MKTAVRKLANAMHRADPAASYSFEFWDGDTIRVGPLPAATVRLMRPRAVRSMFDKGFHGFAESYVSGDLEIIGDMQLLLRLGLQIGFDENNYSFWNKIKFLPVYLKTRNFHEKARKNIEHHYDLSDEFYSLFLDPTMTYSCAYFKTAEDTLEQAQRNKFEHIAHKLMLSPGETLFDVGCGWGGMLIHCAGKYGIKGFGNTLSQNQSEYANRKIREMGLHDRLNIVQLDYRSLSGTFDKFVSIGMFEHVGKEFIPTYMKMIAGILKKGGVGLLHTISKDVEGPTDTWMRQYIFPGGYIPGLPEIVREMGRAGLCILDIENLRVHYAATIDYWITNFEANADKIRRMFDERFVRMWRMYLNASRACFLYDGNRVYQILFSNGLNRGIPWTRDYMYRRDL